MRVIVILATLLCAASLAAQADARPRHPMPPGLHRVMAEGEVQFT